MDVSQTPGREASGAGAWWAVCAVMAGIFLLVTAEQLPIGLLSQVAADLGVTPGLAGLMVTVPGVVAAFAAPLLPVAVGRLDRRVLLAGLMAAMTLASLASALAGSFLALLAARMLVGVCIGGFWAIAGGLAPRLVDEARVPRAMTVIFGGVAAAAVLGVPLGTWLGEMSHWRLALGALGGLSLVTAFALWHWLPPLPADQPVRLGMLVAQVGHRGVRVAVAATAFIVTGHFMAYTFISPLLQELSGIPLTHIGSLLLLYGAAGMVGNLVAGRLAGRHPYRAVLVIPVLLALVVLAYPWLGRVAALGIALLMLWGAVFGAISVSVQSWILRTAPNTEAATALMAFVFNLAIGLGALLGGVVVDAVSLSGALFAAGAAFGAAAWLVGRTPAGIVAAPAR
ncbi:MFS transporter [Halomonas organivorans]